MYTALIVDDNKMQIKSMICFIDWKKYNINDIKVAYNGRDGIEIARQCHPDIIIADIEMPVMNGIDMIREIKKEQPGIKTIFMSCYEKFDYVKDAMENNAISYILKPIDRKELEISVEKLVRIIEEEKKRDDIDKIICKNRNTLLENFLYRQLYLKKINPDDCIELVEQCGLHDFYGFMVARIEFDCPLSGYADVAVALELLQRDFFSNTDGVAVLEGSDVVEVLVMSKNDDCANFYSDTCLRLNELSNELSKIDIICHIKTSKIHSSFYDLNIMLDEAAIAIEEDLTGEHGGECEESYVIFAPVDLKKELELIVDESDEISPERIWLLIDQFCPDNPKCLPNDIQSFYVTAISAAQLFMLDRNLDIIKIFDTSETIWSKQNRFNETATFRQWLYNVLYTVVKAALDDERYNHKRLVSDMIEYINRNYRTITKVEQISNSIYVSASYARSIFKRYMGQTIQEYLTSVRMDEAKRLLSNPNAKVYAVATAVGYKNKPYFVKIFRRMVGMLPGEFKQKAVKGVVENGVQQRIQPDFEE